MGQGVNIGFSAAALAALATFGVHTFVGGVFVARPLLASDALPRASKWLNYYTWHMATAVLLFMAAGFVWAAVSPEARPVAVLLCAMAAVFSPLCIVIALKGGVKPWRFPASWLFLIILGLGLWGLAAQT